MKTQVLFSAVRQFICLFILNLTLFNFLNSQCTAFIPPGTSSSGIVVTETSLVGVSLHGASSSCGYSLPAGAKWLSANNVTSNYTISFSAPVNDIRIIQTYGGTPGAEYFTITTNTDVPVLTTEGCYSFVSGNVLTVGTPNPNQASGGIFTVSCINPYTSLTISSPGSGNGTIFGLCNESISSCTDLNTSVSSTEICLGESLELSATSTSGGTVSWNNSVENGVPFIPTTAGDITYTATSSNINDCPFSTEITVLPSPVLNLSVDHPEICEEESVTLTASGANTYTWSHGQGNNATVTPSAVGMTYYSVVGENSLNGCTSEDSISVEVHALPNLLAFVSELEVCEGDLISVNATGADSYSWSNGVANLETFEPLVGPQSFTVTGTISATGCQNTANTEVLVHALPDVQGVVSDSDICLGDTVIFSATGAHTYDWEGEIIDGIPFVPSSVGSQSYMVTGINVDTRCENTDLVNLTVSSVPDILTYTSASEICLGDSLFVFGSGGDTYSWSDGIINGEYFTPAATGNLTYQVSGTNTSSGCSGTGEIDISVLELPSFSVTAVDTILCLGEGILQEGTGADSYTWSTGLENGEIYTPSSAGLENIHVTGVNSENGCQNTDTIHLEILALPEVEASASELEACLGESIVFSGEGADSYTWNNGVMDSENYELNQAGEVHFSVVGLDEITGCQNSSGVTILIHELPQIEALASTENLCEEEEITLNATGADTYVWAGGQLNGQPFTISDSGEYTFTVSGTNLTTGCSNSDSVSVLVFTNPPNVQGVASSTELCEGETLSLTGSGALEYLWSSGVADGEEFMPSAGNQIFMVIGSVGENGCQDTAYVNVQVYELPEVYAGDDVESCLDSEVTLAVENPENYLEVNWSGGIEDGVSFATQSSGTTTYSVTVTDENTCQNMDEVEVQIMSCDTLIFLPSGISPNADGVNDVLVIEGAGDEKVHLQVFSEWGLKVFEAEDYQNDWGGINTSSASFSENAKLPSGTYYYIAQIGDEMLRNYLYISY